MSEYVDGPSQDGDGPTISSPTHSTLYSSTVATGMTGWDTYAGIGVLHLYNYSVTQYYTDQMLMRFDLSGLSPAATILAVTMNLDDNGSGSAILGSAGGTKEIRFVLSDMQDGVMDVNDYVKPSSNPTAICPNAAYDSVGGDYAFNAAGIAAVDQYKGGTIEIIGLPESLIENTDYYNTTEVRGWYAQACLYFTLTVTYTIGGMMFTEIF